MIGLIIFLIILLLIIFIGYKVYQGGSSFLNLLESPFTSIGSAISGLKCPSDAPYEYQGLCYPTLPTNWQMNSAGRIIYNGGCPSGWSYSSGECTQTGKAQIISQGCSSGQQNYGGVCYDNCPSGTSMTAAGLCSTGEYKPYPLPCGNRQQKGALCYNQCPSGTSMKVAGLCTSSVSSHGISTQMNCPSGYIANPAGLCYSSYDSTWSSPSEGIIIPNCPSGWSANGDITGACYKTGVAIQ